MKRRDGLLPNFLNVVLKFSSIFLNSQQHFLVNFSKTYIRNEQDLRILKQTHWNNRNLSYPFVVLQQVSCQNLCKHEITNFTLMGCKTRKKMQRTPKILYYFYIYKGKYKIFTLDSLAVRNNNFCIWAYEQWQQLYALQNMEREHFFDITFKLKCV